MIFLVLLGQNFEYGRIAVIEIFISIIDQTVLPF